MSATRVIHWTLMADAWFAAMGRGAGKYSSHRWIQFAILKMSDNRLYVASRGRSEAALRRSALFFGTGRFSMLRPGDRVAVGVSGNDSLTLTALKALRILSRC